MNSRKISKRNSGRAEYRAHKRDAAVREQVRLRIWANIDRITDEMCDLLAFPPLHRMGPSKPSKQVTAAGIVLPEFNELDPLYTMCTTANVPSFTGKDVIAVCKDFIKNFKKPEYDYIRCTPEAYLALQREAQKHNLPSQINLHGMPYSDFYAGMPVVEFGSPFDLYREHVLNQKPFTVTAGDHDAPRIPVQRTARREDENVDGDERSDGASGANQGNHRTREDG